MNPRRNHHDERLQIAFRRVGSGAAGSRLGRAMRFRTIAARSRIAGRAPGIGNLSRVRTS